MKISLYNTLGRKKQDFIPLTGNEVRMYSCGPTVYNYAHIGNFRTYIFMDNLRRMLKYNGYTLKHVMNITDVGHLESDADEGEDKMVKAAKRENKDPYAIADFYTKAFFEDIHSLNIEIPETIAKATDHIAEMQAMVEEILANGYAYETSRGIYFDISKLDQYPILSNRKIDEQIAGARVDVDPEKRNPYDFAIWIKAEPNHIMKWESPWGLSYPGWHLECSAMSRKYLGDEFDIHTGGIDHIPTHHENEIAQSKGATGKIPAKFWMHCEFLQIDGGKMSKSLGNTYTLTQLKEKGIEPLAFKLFCYAANYRTKLNFTFEGALAAQKSLNRLREGYLKQKQGNTKVEKEELEHYQEKFLEAINDDLNIPQAMGLVWEIIRKTEKSEDYAKLLEKFDEVLGLDLVHAQEYLEKETEEVNDEIQELVAKRDQARLEKNWALSDEIRDQLQQKGYQVKDTKEGTMIEKA